MSLSLLILMMSAACADVELLVYSNGWNLDDTPVDVRITADVQAHMPFDDDRLKMLTPISDMLTMHLIAGQNEGFVGIEAQGEELLSLQYRGNDIQLSCLPDRTYRTNSSDVNAFLTGNAKPMDLYSILGLNPDGESLLTDGKTLLSAFTRQFEQYGKRTTKVVNISGIGRSAYTLDFKFQADQTELMRTGLLSICPDGWLRDIIKGFSFTGEQTVRMHFGGDDTLVRVAYKGTCGKANDLRQVSLIYKMQQESDLQKDYIELSAPSQTGKNKNTLIFDRTKRRNQKGEVSLDGMFKYTVLQDGVTSICKGEFVLTNACSEDADHVSGELTIQQMLDGAEKYSTITLLPDIRIAGSCENPDISGELSVIEKYAGNVTEHAALRFSLKRAEPMIWTERETTVNLSKLDASAEKDIQQEMADAISKALVVPLLVKLGSDAQWFFRDLPDDVVQSIVDAAAAQYPSRRIE